MKENKGLIFIGLFFASVCSAKIPPCNTQNCCSCYKLESSTSFCSAGEYTYELLGKK